MKKFTFVAMMAAAALAANAQYMVDPGVEAVLKGGKVTSVAYLALDGTTIGTFEKQGAKCVNIGPNGDNQNLWVWDNTFAGYDGSYPGVDFQTEGYAAFQIGNVGWSGAGYNVVAPGFSTMEFTDKTRFHIGYMAPGTVCPSIGLILLDQDGANTPAKVSLGAAFNDNGVVFPSIGATETDDWQGVDISLGDLKKLFPGFAYNNTEAWTGNVMSFLAGGVTGQTFAFDAIYFYNYDDNGVADIELDQDAPVQYFNLQGVAVQGELTPGLYITRQGAKVSKVVVK